MKLSSLPFLLAVLLGFIIAASGRAYQRGQVSRPELQAVFGLVAFLGLWGILSAYLSKIGLYKSQGFLALVPGLWLPLVPVALTIIPIAAFPTLRAGIFKTIDFTPLTWFAYIQALRITALGTAVKTIQGQFPVIVEVFLGFPDFLFGVSALWVAIRVGQGALSERFWVYWHGLGAAIILVMGTVVINMSLPGPFQVFSTPPTFLVAFEFPLALAPTFAVPLFVMYNLAGILKVYPKRTVNSQPNNPQ